MPEWCPTPPTPRPVQDRRQMLDCLPGSIAHLGWRRLYITGFIRQKMIEKFSNPDNIEDPSLKDPTGQPAIWRKEPPTGILIESIYRWRGELVGKRPAILVKPGAYRNQRITLADSAGIDKQTFSLYTTLWVGSHTVFCIHETGASCEALAAEVQRELTEFAPEIVRSLNLMRFQVMEFDEPRSIEEATQNFGVPINIAIAFQQTWQLRSNALPLAAVSLEAIIKDELSA
jgi:hypothetical protein